MTKMMTNTAEIVETEGTKIKKPKMMKNGITDRSFSRWIRILVVTAVWWGFVFGFYCLCFFLMYLVLYGSGNDAQPYFPRSFMKYPEIFVQPGLNIKCLMSRETNTMESCNTTELSVSVNKIFNFVPYPYIQGEFPDEVVDELKRLGIALKGLERNMMFVTCDGRKQEDKDDLEGMKISSGSRGIRIDKFPWTVDTEDWPQVSFDLSSTKVVMDKKKKKVSVECRAWAWNIDTEDRFVDKMTPRGGALSVFCFDNGKIVKIKDCDD